MLPTGNNKILPGNIKIILIKKPLRRRKRSLRKRFTDMKIGINDKDRKRKSHKARNSDKIVHEIYYEDVLRKLASDLGALKLNDRFHCTGAISHSVQIKPTFVIFIFIALILIL